MRRQAHRIMSRRGSPSWFDEDNNKECDHDATPERIRTATGYSDFGYFRNQCGDPDCDETWDYWIEG